jgi:hypothetical protein
MSSENIRHMIFRYVSERRLCNDDPNDQSARPSSDDFFRNIHTQRLSKTTSYENHPFYSKHPVLTALLFEYFQLHNQDEAAELLSAQNFKKFSTMASVSSKVAGFPSKIKFLRIMHDDIATHNDAGARRSSIATLPSVQTRVYRSLLHVLSLCHLHI